MEVPADNISEKTNNAIDPELPTKVIVHGFGSSCDHIWVYEMRSALMAVIECNIGDFNRSILSQSNFRCYSKR
jgi:hypothetical protein